jgi:hypothetical protein
MLYIGTFYKSYHPIPRRDSIPRPISTALVSSNKSFDRRLAEKFPPFNVIPTQCDQMGLLKIAQNIAQSGVVLPKLIEYIFHGRRLKCWASFVIFKKVPKVNIGPIWSPCSWGSSAGQC